MTGKRTNFLLKTMGQEKVIPTFALSGMEVADLAGKSFYPLPEVLTQKEMPVTPDNIVTAADLQMWPYLSKVHVSSIKANVDRNQCSQVTGTMGSGEQLWIRSIRYKNSVGLGYQWAFKWKRKWKSFPLLW